MAVGILLYYFYLNTPKRLSRICPEIGRADGCSVTIMDGNMESTSMSFEGREREELIGHLDSFQCYPYPERKKAGGAVALEGGEAWNFYFRIDGKPAAASVLMTERGYLAIGKRTYQIRGDDFSPLPAAPG